MSKYEITSIIYIHIGMNEILYMKISIQNRDKEEDRLRPVQKVLRQSETNTDETTTTKTKGAATTPALYHGIIMGLASILGRLQLDTLTLHQVTLLVVVSFQVIDPANKRCIFFKENSSAALKVFVDSEIKLRNSLFLQRKMWVPCTKNKDSVHMQTINT